MAVLLVTAQSFLKVPELVAVLTDLAECYQLKVVAAGDISDLSPTQCLDVKVWLVGREQVCQASLAQLPHLEFIAKYGVGLDNIVMSDLKQHSIGFRACPGVNAAHVAEFTLGVMLGLVRNIAYTSHRLRTGVWHKNGGRDLGDMTVGIVGYGAIGSRVGRLLKAFGAEVWYTDILRSEQLTGIELAKRADSLSDLLSRVDLVSLHVPLTSLTQGLLGQDELALLRPGSYVVNTSRGGVLDLEALQRALQSGHLAGAACDVFPIEPCIDQAILQEPGFLATPHIAGNSCGAVLAMGNAAIEAIKGFLEHKGERYD